MTNLVYKILPPISPNRNTYLDNERLRFSQPEALNDPFECLNFHPLNFRKKAVMGIYRDSLTALKRIYRGIPPASELLKIERIRDRMIAEAEAHWEEDCLFSYKQALVKFNNTYGVLSLANDWKNTLMWSHYAYRHRGYCVGFDKTHPFFVKQSAQKTELRKVTYGDARLDLEKDVFDNNRPTGFLFYKSHDWIYEQEWRIVMDFNAEGDLDVMDWKLDNSGEKSTLRDDFLLPVKLVRVPFESVRELIVGMDADQVLTEKLVSLGRTLGVKVYKTIPSLEKLDLERREIAL